MRKSKQTRSDVPNFSSALLKWFDQYGRKNLPWQHPITAYRVWISEIMLQQTQVSTVIPYFTRFLKKFPDIHSLATAALDEVLHLWTGLGYYARARNLHKTAEIIELKYQGHFPNELEILQTLPGIGRSTAGAILSIAFDQSMSILDGNVKRVLCRYHAVEGHPSEKKIEQLLWKFSTAHTPINRCADYTQAIMDLGATVCIRSKPNCLICPLQNNCQAFKDNQVANFPTPKKRAPIPTKNTFFIIFSNEKKEILLEKRSPIGIWGGLWSFPESSELNHKEYEKKYGLKIKNYRTGEMFKHTFSHFHLQITPVYVEVKQSKLSVTDNEQRQWCNYRNLPNIGLAAPVKKLLES